MGNIKWGLSTLKPAGYFFSAVASLALAAPIPAMAQQPAPPPKPALQPGQWRIMVHTPSDWVLQIDPRMPGTKSYLCKPLACYDPAIVSLTAASTLAKHPDPRALDRLAKVQLPRNLLAQSMAGSIMTEGAKQTQLISSVAGTVTGYPAVLMEAKIIDEQRISYLATDIIFENSVMLTIVSSASSRDDAKRHIDLFLSGVELEEGPSIDPAAPVAPPVAAVPSATPASPTQSHPGQIDVDGRRAL
jgi:hypothetical protein